MKPLRHRLGEVLVGAGAILLLMLIVDGIAGATVSIFHSKKLLIVGISLVVIMVGILIKKMKK